MIFKKTLLFAALTIFGLFGFSVRAQQSSGLVPQAPVVLNASIDSATITMGERTTLRVELVKNGHSGNTLIPLDKESSKETGKMSIGGIEIRQAIADSTELGNNRIQVNYEFLLQPFEPKDFTIPAFKYAIDGDTLTSNVVALKVIEPEIPQEMRDSLIINPLRPPMTIKAEWYDWVPDWLSDYWYWWIIGLLIAGLAIAAFILYRKNGKTFFPAKKIVPPYELAIKRLGELKRKRLHEQGHNKAYYTELTDILRQYLGGRFKIYALEMTSNQILEAMRNNVETAPFTKELQPMFEIADFVKFAKQNSTPDENIRSFNSVERFVNETKPAEQENKTEKK